MVTSHSQLLAIFGVVPEKVFVTPLRTRSIGKSKAFFIQPPHTQHLSSSSKPLDSLLSPAFSRPKSQQSVHKNRRSFHPRQSSPHPSAGLLRFQSIQSRFSSPQSMSPASRTGGREEIIGGGPVGRCIADRIFRIVCSVLTSAMSRSLPPQCGQTASLPKVRRSNSLQGMYLLREPFDFFSP